MIGSQQHENLSAQPAHQPLCHFVTGARGSGKTRHILECLRKIAATESATGGNVAVMLAEQGRTRAESLSAAFPGLVLRKLFLPCQCCPELAQLPSALRAAWETNPRLEQIFVEAPDVAAARFLEEFDAVLGWPRKVVTCVSASWCKARRLGMLTPFQAALLEKADVLVEAGELLSAEGGAHAARDENSPTAAPFDLSLT